MTHTKDEALKLALEALKFCRDNENYGHTSTLEAIAAIKQALAAPVQEPVAYEYWEEVYWHTNPALNDYIRANGKELVYSTPPAAQPAPVVITTGMAVAFHRATSDGSISNADAKEIKIGLEAAFANIATPPAQPAYKDNTPNLGVGDSAFESLFSEYHIANDMIKPKQVARDAYAAGMGDPLVAPAAQPTVPDAFGTREGEHPQYIQGWNDCRAEMLKGMKT